jgi:hypothetical protein
MGVILCAAIKKIISKMWWGVQNDLLPLPPAKGHFEELCEKVFAACGGGIFF